MPWQLREHTIESKMNLIQRTYVEFDNLQDTFLPDKMSQLRLSMMMRNIEILNTVLTWSNKYKEMQQKGHLSLG